MKLSELLTKEIEINFDLEFNVSKEILFEFIIHPKNMPLYTGFFLAPGILSVVTSTPIREKGTIDFITNTDGSTHQSLTYDFVKPDIYYLNIYDIKTNGLKKIFDIFLNSFSEKWDFFSIDQKNCRVKRSLIIKFNFLVIFLLPTAIFVEWVFKRALDRHHQNLINTLS